MAEAAKSLSKLLKLCDAWGEELLRLDKIFEPHAPRRAELCALLKEAAKERGENYQIVIDKLGRAKITAPKEKAAKGETYELDLGAFLRLPERERDRLLERGIAKKVTQYTGAYYGSVTTELFP
jgi:hypothetical protein